MWRAYFIEVLGRNLRIKNFVNKFNGDEVPDVLLEGQKVMAFLQVFRQFVPDPSVKWKKEIVAKSGYGFGAGTDYSGAAQVIVEVR